MSAGWKLGCVPVTLCRLGYFCWGRLPWIAERSALLPGASVVLWINDVLPAKKRVGT